MSTAQATAAYRGRGSTATQDSAKLRAGCAHDSRARAAPALRAADAGVAAVVQNIVRHIVCADEAAHIALAPPPFGAKKPPELHPTGRV